MKFTLMDWLNGVQAGQRIITVVPVKTAVGNEITCWDVMVDGEAAKRIYTQRRFDAQKDAERRAQAAFDLYADDKQRGRTVCPHCQRSVGVVKGRYAVHNTLPAEAGRVGEQCQSSNQPMQPAAPLPEPANSTA